MNLIAPHLAPFAAEVSGLQRIGNHFWTRGWSVGTSSNYSVVVQRDPLQLLITASGKDKGHLEDGDFVLIDEFGTPTRGDQPKSSAETLLHCLAAKRFDAGAILHTHSVWGTILSQHFFGLGGIRIHDFEMLKGLEGIGTHEANCWIPIFDNTQNIPALVSEVERYTQEHSNERLWGFLIRHHGLYTWGKTLADASRHIEILEFLFECIGRTLKH